MSTINSRIQKDAAIGRVLVGQAMRTTASGANMVQNVYRVNPDYVPTEKSD